MADAKSMQNVDGQGWKECQRKDSSHISFKSFQVKHFSKIQMDLSEKEFHLSTLPGAQNVRAFVCVVLMLDLSPLLLLRLFIVSNMYTLVYINIRSLPTVGWWCPCGCRRHHRHCNLKGTIMERVRVCVSFHCIYLHNKWVWTKRNNEIKRVNKMYGMCVCTSSANTRPLRVCAHAVCLRFCAKKGCIKCNGTCLRVATSRFSPSLCSTIFCIALFI